MLSVWEYAYDNMSPLLLTSNTSLSTNVDSLLDLSADTEWQRAMPMKLESGGPMYCH